MLKKTRNYKGVSVLILVTLLLSLCSCGNRDKKVSKSGFYFDTIITITLYNTSDENYIDECFDIASDYEQKLSNTIDTSEISQINKNAGKEYVKVSEETIELLKTGLSYCRQSDGVFDITIGKLSDLWNISNIAKECQNDSNQVDESNIPDSEQIDTLKSGIDYNKVLIKGDKVMLSDSDCKIDLGAVAKGFIADKMKDYLNSKGISSGIINLGGNILTIGTKTDGTNYHVGIQKPFADSGESLLSIEVSDKSVVTSGIYERYFEIDDKIYHHILDINTGYPCENDLYSVTIVSDKSVDGDALSTICFLKGAGDGMKYIEALDGVEAVFIKNDYSIEASSGIKDSIKINE